MAIIRLQKELDRLIMGDNEQATGTVSVRLRSGDERGALPLTDRIARRTDEASRKAGSPGST